MVANPRLPANASTPRAQSRRAVLAGLGLSIAGTAWSRRALAQTPARIVAVGGVITEVIYALGLQDRLVGVDTTSQYPAEALKEKRSVGYVRQLSAEGVLSLNPTLVIVIDGAGPPDALSLLNESGVKIARIPEDPSPDGVVTRIGAIGAVVGAVEPARRLAQQARARFDEVAALREKLGAKKRVLFVLSLQNGRALVGGRNTTADAIVTLAGGQNAAAAIEGYKPMSDEAIIAAAPEVVVMMSHSSAHDAPADELFGLPAFAQTPAAKDKRLVRMDGLYLLGFGPRAPLAARDLMAQLYPDAAIPQLASSP